MQVALIHFILICLQCTLIIINAANIGSACAASSRVKCKLLISKIFTYDKFKQNLALYRKKEMVLHTQSR